MAALKFTLTLAVAAFLAGCATATDHRLVIKPGGYLEEKDYAAFQQEADKRKPISLPKKWQNPSPVISYIFEPDFDFRSLERITVPDLTLAPMPGATTNWITHKHTPLYQSSIANHIATHLVSEKLVKEAPRTGDSPANLVGAITYFKDGSVIGGQLEGKGSQTFLQTEFKVIANGRKVGAIQINGVRPKTLIGVVGVPTMEEQIAKGVITAFKGMKTNFREDQKNDFVLPDWFIK